MSTQATSNFESARDEISEKFDRESRRLRRPFTTLATRSSRRSANMTDEAKDAVLKGAESTAARSQLQLAGFQRSIAGCQRTLGEQ